MAGPSPRWDLPRLAAEHVTPRPIPRAPTDRLIYGLVQPLVGARLVAGDRELLRAAVIPGLLLAAICLGVAVAQTGGAPAGDVLRSFYTTFLVLAPFPSVLLAHHYARLAVMARRKLGFSPAEPCLEPLKLMLSRAVKQTILIALAVAPAGALLRMVPGIGWLLVKLLAALWALHWIVVDAFDAARFLRPGQTVADLEAHALTLPSPWFVRWLEHAAEALPFGGKLVRKFARALDRLSRPWREEIALVESHPALTAGFALTTAALLALPVVNMLFRPIVIAGAAHVLGRLETLEPESPVLPP